MCGLANNSTWNCINSAFYHCFWIRWRVLYHFLERVFPGLHHFIYAPIEVGPVVVNHGLKAEWLQHLNQFAESSKPLKNNSIMDLFTRQW